MPLVLCMLEHSCFGLHCRAWTRLAAFCVVWSVAYSLLGTRSNSACIVKPGCQPAAAACCVVQVFSLLWTHSKLACSAKPGWLHVLLSRVWLLPGTHSQSRHCVSIDGKLCHTAVLVAVFALRYKHCVGLTGAPTTDCEGCGGCNLEHTFHQGSRSGVCTTVSTL